MNRLFVGAALLLTLVGSGASAQVTQTDLSVNLTTTQANCVPPDSSRKVLSIQNLASSGNIGYCFRTAAAPSTACTPVIGTKGTFTIPASGLYYWPYGSAPVNGLDCIASTSIAASITSGK